MCVVCGCVSPTQQWEWMLMLKWNRVCVCVLCEGMKENSPCSWLLDSKRVSGAVGRRRECSQARGCHTAPILCRSHLAVHYPTTLQRSRYFLGATTNN
jgi:hypothetical protein